MDAYKSRGFFCLVMTGWALLAVLVVGGIVYYVAQYLVGERM